MFQLMRRWFWLGVVLLGGRLTWAGSPVPEIIDVPTADVIDTYGYQVGFRFYSNGGLLSKPTFGVFPRLNIGFGLDVERVIGNQSADLNRPTLNAKFRFFDGSRALPSLALGYDGQGYFYDKVTDEFRQREKGLYLAGSGEIFTPGLNLHGGVNVYDFVDDHAYGFLALQYLHEDTFGFSAEWDNVRTGRESRINLGLRYNVTPSFAVDIAGRDLFAPSRDPERIVRLVYTGGF